MIARDKQLHFFVCMIISVSLMILFRIIGSPIVMSSIGAWLTATGTGLGKEYGDKNAVGNFWDWYDVLADILGATFGTLLSTLLWLI